MGKLRKPLSDLRKKERDQIMGPILLRLVTARRVAGLSQRDVSRLLNVSGSGAMNSYESGRVRLSLDLFLQLCALYQTNPMWIISGGEGESSNGELLRAIADRVNILLEREKKEPRR